MTFRVCGIRFDISYYFFALLAAFFILEPDSITACGALAAVFHECGHIAATMLVPDGQVIRVNVGICGVRMTTSLPGGYKGWIPVCIAGAAVNLFISALSFAAALAAGSRFFSVFASANLCIGAVNLLPVEPLDGGQLLRAVLLRLLQPEIADRISFSVSLFTLIPLAAASLWLLMQTSNNFSLLVLTLWLAAGLLNEYF